MAEDKIPKKWTNADFVRHYKVEMDFDYDRGDGQWEHVAHSKILMIEDAKTLKGFLANAKALWIRRHDPTRQRGRPSERGRVFTILWNDEFKGGAAKRITQGKLIQLVREQLGTDSLSKDAIRKYVKMWLILKRNGRVIPDLALPDANLRWLDKHATKVMKAIRAFHKLSEHIPPTEKIKRLSGTLLRSAAMEGKLDVEELFNLPHFSPDVLDAEHDLRNEIQDFLPPKPAR